MARYNFRFDSADKSLVLSKTLEFPSLSEALVRANFVARKLVKQQVRGLIKVHGRVDVVDAITDIPLARILLADIAARMA